MSHGPKKFKKVLINILNYQEEIVNLTNGFGNFLNLVVDLWTQRMTMELVVFLHLDFFIVGHLDLRGEITFKDFF